jgi:hypothetical protein
MTEQNISFDAAVLAKQIGFSVGSESYYNVKHKDLRVCGSDSSGFMAGAKPTNTPTSFGTIEAPTQSLLQKWLRHEAQVHIEITRETIGSDEWVFGYKIHWLPKEFWDAKRRCLHFQYIESFSESPGGTYTGGWDTYEEALENALLRAMKSVAADQQFVILR